MKLLVNGIPLLSPLTGIGQYTRQLCSELVRQPDIDLLMSYGMRYERGLHLPSASTTRSLQAGYSLLRKILPRPRQLKRLVEETRFTWTSRRILREGYLYHEPNLLPLPYEGPTVITLHDLSCFDHPETHPEERVSIMHRELPPAVERVDHIIVISEATRRAVQQRFGVGFETVCHRLSTLQRSEAPGVPFFFVRVDRAGNISKRQSATHFHFSRTGGTCPLWNVYEAFGQPERVLRQIATMPDGRSYLWIARTVSGGQRGYGAPGKTFSVGLGCDIRHACHLVYAQGLDLHAPAAATPIGMGCKVCERHACPQRAFPYIGRALDVDENHSRFTPYGAGA